MHFDYNDLSKTGANSQLAYSENHMKKKVREKRQKRGGRPFFEGLPLNRMILLREWPQRGKI